MLDGIPDTAPGWEPGLEAAVASMRLMPAYGARNIADAVRYAAEADRLFAPGGKCRTLVGRGAHAPRALSRTACSPS